MAIAAPSQSHRMLAAIFDEHSKIEVKMKFILSSVSLFVLLSCSSTKQTSKEIVTTSGLSYFVLKQGTGEPTKQGQKFLYMKQWVC